MINTGSVVCYVVHVTLTFDLLTSKSTQFIFVSTARDFIKSNQSNQIYLQAQNIKENSWKKHKVNTKKSAVTDYEC